MVADTENDMNADGVNTSQNSADSSTQRPFSKAMSVVSMSSINCPSNELLSNLDGELSLIALEHILTLVASQTLFALKNPQLSLREKQLIRREVSSELMSYHDFVRKKVIIESREHKDNSYQRRKQGQVLMQKIYPRSKNGNGTDDGADANTSRNGMSGNVGLGSSNGMRSNAAAADAQRRPSSNLRVNVVRKMHLQQQQERQQGGPQNGFDKFEMSRIMSPIAGGQGRRDVPIVGPTESTPCWQKSTPSSNDDELMDEDDDDVDNEIDAEKRRDEIDYYPPEEPNYSPLSFVQFVEEDYLHFMSNLFHVICQQND